MIRRPLTTVTLEATELDPILVDCDVNKIVYNDNENSFYAELMVWVNQLIKLNIVPTWLPSKSEIAELDDTEMHDLWLRVGCVVEDFTEEQEALLHQGASNSNAESIPTPSLNSNRSNASRLVPDFSPETSALQKEQQSSLLTSPSPTPSGRRRVLEQIEMDMHDSDYTDPFVSPDVLMQSYESTINERNESN